MRKELNEVDELVKEGDKCVLTKCYLVTYSLGVFPKYFLNMRLKYLGSLNPTS